jgi:hypothetical protein
MPANITLNDPNLAEGSTTVVPITGGATGITFIATNINPKQDVVNITAHDQTGKKRGRLTKIIGMSGTATLQTFDTSSVIPHAGDKFVATANYFATGSAFTASFTEVSAPRAINEIWNVDVSYEDVPSTFVP